MRWRERTRLTRRRARRVLHGVVAGAGAALGSGASALGASPAPSDALSGDPRSSGQGPGLVGDPAGAIAAVLLVAFVALALTLLYVRATGDNTDRR